MKTPMLFLSLIALTSGHKLYQQVLLNLNDDGDLIADILASTDSIEE